MSHYDGDSTSENVRLTWHRRCRRGSWGSPSPGGCALQSTCGSRPSRTPSRWCGPSRGWSTGVPARHTHTQNNSVNHNLSNASVVFLTIFGRLGFIIKWHTVAMRGQSSKVKLQPPLCSSCLQFSQVCVSFVQTRVQLVLPWHVSAELLPSSEVPLGGVCDSSSSANFKEARPTCQFLPLSIFLLFVYFVLFLVLLFNWALTIPCFTTLLFNCCTYVYLCVIMPFLYLTVEQFVCVRLC